MAIKNSAPMRFSPKGLTDAYDATDEFQGACQQLSNLILDQSNPELVIPRPGVVTLQQLSGAFVNPSFISIQVAIGTRIYGLVATTKNVGHDEPFCYDTSINAFVPISGVTAANTPTSPSTTGDWEPPTMASIGVFIILTHPGFSGTGANFFGVIDLTVPTAPAWSSSNTATTPLTARPSAVANLNNRAYYAVGNQLQFSDVLLPKTRTAATQAITLGDSAPINALGGLPITTTSSGILAVLTAFKTSQIWQVSGDPTTNDLAENYLSLTTGTNAPRTLAQSTLGLYFMSSGGPYFIDPTGVLRPLSNNANNIEPDVQIPFINAVTPTRWCGCYNSSIYRVCGPTVIRGVQQTSDYWFDEHKRRWSGPHTFTYDCASALGGYFVLSSANQPGALMRSQSSPQLTSVYTDLGAQYACILQSSTFPKSGGMDVKQVAESQIELGGAPTGVTYAITAQDEQGNSLGACSITVAATPTPTWGAVIWGAFTWASAQNIAPHTYPVPWPAPLVFEKMQVLITATASANVQIGTFYARYQKTGYMVIQ